MDTIQIEQRFANNENILLPQKNALTIDDAANYRCISTSYLHKMPMLGSIAFSILKGQTTNFDRVLLENFLLQNWETLSYEIKDKANSHVTLFQRRASK